MWHHPRLIVTYSQLLELLKCEIAPSAATSASGVAWCELTYDGDLEKFMTILTKLLLQYPLEPATACTMAARSFGKELQCCLSAMNAMYKPNGMSIPEIKTQIRNFVIERESSPLFSGWKGNNNKTVPQKHVRLRNIQVEDSPTKSPHIKPNKPLALTNPKTKPFMRDDRPMREQNTQREINLSLHNVIIPQNMVKVRPHTMSAEAANILGFSVPRRKEENVLYVVRWLIQLVYICTKIWTKA